MNEINLIKRFADKGSDRDKEENREQADGEKYHAGTGGMEGYGEEQDAAFVIRSQTGR